MKIYTRITFILLIIINFLIAYYGEDIGNKIILNFACSILYFLFAMFLIPLMLNFIDEYYNLIKKDIEIIYKEIIKFLKFYTNI